MHIYKMIGRNLEVTDAMRTYAEDKLEKLERFSDQIVDARVVMSYNEGDNGGPAKVEVQDTYAAVDLVVDKLERQLKRFKGRFIARRNEEKPTPDVPEPESQEPVIVRTKKHTLRPMAPEDAAVQMEALGHDFFVFHNHDTDSVNVIYKRHDGDYGLIEPA